MSEVSSSNNVSANVSSTSLTNSDGIPKKSRVSRGNYGGKNLVKNRGFRRKNSTGGAGGEEDLDDEEQCIICANRIEYAALTPCNHKTCHKCTLRQRALYEKSSCLVCRSENESIVISDQVDKTFSDFKVQDFVKNDEKYQINFTSKSCYEDSMALLRDTCQICSREFASFKELGEHAKAEHGKFYCFICSEHKKAFISELQMYTYKQLLKHQSEGDQIGFKGHPECKYCQGKRFYSEDELNIHIRDRHERCYICDQNLPKTADYYRNYDSLYNHFKRDHYVCSVPSCVEKRFVVFRDDLDLTAHMLKEHGGVGNNKIVIGSNGFRSQLSTFETAARNNASWQSSHEEEDHNNPEVKKRRLEERAKHYLNYDQTKLQKFLNINSSYRNKKITAKNLYDEYKLLFENESIENLSLLIKEFAELFSTNSDNYKNLQPILQDLDQLNTQSQFPVLGGSSSGRSTPNIPTWVKTPTKKGAKNNQASNELFPMLTKSNKPVPQVNNTPIKYSRVVISPTPQNKVKVNKYQPVNNFIPSYLNNLSPSTSATSQPASSGSNSLRPISPSVQAYSNPASVNGSSSAINESKFPALQKKPKKIIPRVNPITVTDPKKWGTTTAVSPPPEEDPTDFGVGVIVKKGKGRRK